MTELVPIWVGVALNELNLGLFKIRLHYIKPFGSPAPLSDDATLNHLGQLSSVLRTLVDITVIDFTLGTIEADGLLFFAAASKYP